MSENRFRLAYEKGNEAIFEDLAEYPYPRRMTNKEVERKLNEQQATINKLREILAEAEDMIEVRLAEHYIQEYENIKHHIIGRDV